VKSPDAVDCTPSTAIAGMVVTATPRRRVLLETAVGPAVVTGKVRDGDSESFPTQLFETADVSLIEGTIAFRNYWFFFTSPRNGIEEADGSIAFSSTTSFPTMDACKHVSARRRRSCDFPAAAAAL
jgi:hypothetical protein